MKMFIVYLILEIRFVYSHYIRFPLILRYVDGLEAEWERVRLLLASVYDQEVWKALEERRRQVAALERRITELNREVNLHLKEAL